MLDFGVIVLGAEAARLFCDQGAEVIKIESRAFPDGARVSPVHFAIGHRGSRGLGVNLRTAEGVDVIKRLVARSDVVLANFKPGTLDKLGLGAQALREINPGIVVVNSSAVGATGPWSTWMGYGPLVRCVSGLTSLWRYPDDDGGFSDSTTIHPDHYAARVTAITALAALIGRRRSGRGAEIATSQAETILMQIGELLVEESLRPGAVQATGNAGRHAAPWGVYPCAGDDEWCVVTVRDDDDWRRLRGALGDPDWAQDEDLATTAGRLARRAEIDEHLTAWTRERPPREVTATLQAAGVPAGFMQRAAEYEDDPQLQARDFLRTFEQPGLEPMAIEHAPFRSERIPPPANSAGARAGGAHARDLHGVARHGRRRGRSPPRERRARGAGAQPGPGAARTARVTCSQSAISVMACSGQVPAASSAASSRSAGDVDRLVTDRDVALVVEGRAGPGPSGSSDRGPCSSRRRP